MKNLTLLVMVYINFFSLAYAQVIKGNYAIKNVQTGMLLRVKDANSKITKIGLQDMLSDLILFGFFFNKSIIFCFSSISLFPECFVIIAKSSYP